MCKMQTKNVAGDDKTIGDRQPSSQKITFIA